VWHVFLFFLRKMVDGGCEKMLVMMKFGVLFFLKSSIKLGGVFLMRKMLFFHTI